MHYILYTCRTCWPMAQYFTVDLFNQTWAHSVMF